MEPGGCVGVHIMQALVAIVLAECKICLRLRGHVLQCLAELLTSHPCMAGHGFVACEHQALTFSVMSKLTAC